MSQMVGHATRTTENSSSILDIFLTNCPGLVNHCEVIPGISDHDIPYLDISTRIILNKKTPRIIYQFNKADVHNIITHVTNFANTFRDQYSSAESWDIEAMWNSIRDVVLYSINTYVPSKKLSSKKQSLPWINSKVRQAI